MNVVPAREKGAFSSWPELMTSDKFGVKIQACLRFVTKCGLRQPGKPHQRKCMKIRNYIGRVPEKTPDAQAAQDGYIEDKPPEVVEQPPAAPAAERTLDSYFGASQT